MKTTVHFDNKSLSVLITNITLAGRSGTEIVTRDLALGLLKRGHRPVVYTPMDGPIAQELRNVAIPVVTRIGDVEADIDIIHGHHTPVAATAICRYPGIPAVFIAHDAAAWHDVPPLFPSVQFFVSVDTTVAERLAAEVGIDQRKLRVILNAVDTHRFLPGPPLPAKPRRALAFAKNFGHVDAIRRACRARGIAVDFVGKAVGKVVDAPEALLGQYDLVFTSALSALEAMACGRAVVVCDGRGMAGYVTVERARIWRPQNFGLRSLARPVSEAALLVEIDAYDRSQSTQVCQDIREQANQVRWLDEIEDIYRQALAEHARGRETGVALATARHMERWSPRLDARWPWMLERQQLVRANELLEFGGPRPEFDVKYLWNESSAPCMIVRLRGFGQPEEWGVWVAAATASAKVRLPDLPDGQDLRLSFELIPFVVRDNPALEVDVIINGQFAATWVFGTHQRMALFRHIFWPKAQLHDPEHIWLSFKIRNACSPLEYELGEDARRLSVGMIGLTFSAQEKRPRLQQLIRSLGRKVRPMRK